MSDEHKLIYKPHYPGYLNTSKQPNNMCIPCCYATPITEGDNIKRHHYRLNKDKGDEMPDLKKDANGNIILDEKDDIVVNNNKKGSIQEREKIPKNSKRIVEFNNCDVRGKENSKETITTTDVPLGPNKFPLMTNQFGHLPLNVQHLMFLEKQSCYKRTLKKNYRKNV